MTEPPEPYTYLPPPKYRAVTADELVELRRRAGGDDKLEIVPREGGLAIVVRGDGSASWALQQLALMRDRSGEPGSRRPTSDPNWAGRVLRDMIRRMAVNVPNLATPWGELPTATRQEWAALAHEVWTAAEFGGPWNEEATDYDDDDGDDR